MVEFVDFYRKREKDLAARGLSPAEIEIELDRLYDKANRFSWAVEHPEDYPLAAVGGIR